ncbi:MAG: hypothetical protein ACLTNO_09780 [Blautia sp.]
MAEQAADYGGRVCLLHGRYSIGLDGFSEFWLSLDSILRICRRVEFLAFVL